MSESKYKKAFGEALEKQLQARRMSQRSLTDTINASGKSASPQYISGLMRGAKSVSPQWADIIATALNLSDDERQKLHAAAASDLGYKLDLTKKPPPSS